MFKFTAVVFMAIRFNTLRYTFGLHFLKGILILLFVLSASSLLSQEAGKTEDTKKEAEKLFKEEDYARAYKLYSQLVSTYPKDPLFNYRLGVCMIFAEPDKKKSLPFLKLAAASSDEDIARDARFFLGKAHHINYRFDDAIRYYNEFRQLASSSQQKKFEVDREIKACAHGKLLLSNLTTLEVLNKKELGEADYFRSYDLKKIGGKLLVKPDEFRTSADKRKKDKSVVYLPPGGDVVYFSSYGDKAENGKDIYSAARLSNGTYSKPQKISGINTEFDEDYPFLHPDGKTLYFASKGHNSMGGYDIFKSELNESTGTWGAPVNMEFPINSPDDDYLFVTDSLESTAYFSTGRQSPPGKIDVLKVRTARKAIELVAVKGAVIKGEEEYSLASSIQVKDAFNDEELGNYQADDDGSYIMELPNAGKLLFTVSTPGLETQSAQVTLPKVEASKPFRQTISYEKGKLRIQNYFDEPASDNSYLQYLGLIEKQAKLDINSADNATTDRPEVSDPPTKENPRPSVVSEDPGAKSVSSSKKMDNKQLYKMARQDAMESKMEAAQLKKDSKDARIAGEKQKTDADKKMAEADKALKVAETLSDETEKQKAIEEAKTLRKNAENDLVVANRILSYAENLEEDAGVKEKEASLNDQYATELEKVINTKTPDQNTLAKLEELHNEIQTLSAETTEPKVKIESLQNEISDKDQQLTALSQANVAINSNLEEIKSAIAQKEAELSQTKKKKDKAEINEQITVLRNEQSEKENQITANNEQIKRIETEVATLKSELAITNDLKTKSEKRNAIENSTVTLTSDELKKKYSDQVKADPDDKSSLEQSISALNDYNKDLDKSITKNKNDLAKTKDPAAKKRISAEIKKLEESRKINQQLVSGNFNRITEINKAAAANQVNTDNFPIYEPVSAETPAEAITLLNELTTDFTSDSEKYTLTETYDDPRAQSLRAEADQLFLDAQAKQKKLVQDIAVSAGQIREISSKTVAPVITADQYYTEVEALQTEAQKLRSEAKTAEGSQKEELLSRAKTMEEQAADKNIAAADINRSDNAVIVATNKENIQNLLKTNKASQEDQDKARALSDEAVAAYRKASEIRSEANSLTSKGAKLGSLSNAEEKEAEAKLRQQEAIDLLMKSDPTFELKPIITSTTMAASSSTQQIGFSTALDTVNLRLSELASIKKDGYQKLFEANETELDQLMASILEKQDKLDKNTRFKNDLSEADKRITDSRTSKGKSEQAEKPTDKVNHLIVAVNHQDNALKQLRKLKTALDKPEEKIPDEPVVTAPVVPAASEPVRANTTNTLQTSVAEPVAPQQQTEKRENEPVTTDTASLSPASGFDATIIEVGSLAGKDTTTSDLISYFDTNEPSAQNRQADENLKSSLSKLKDIDALIKNVDSEIAANTAGQGSASVNPKDLRGRADELLVESEDLGEESEEVKKLASKASGEEKQKLQREAAELQKMSQSKLMESADMVRQANESEINTNTKAIIELIEKLKTDNPAMAVVMENNRTELVPLYSQGKNLREEANSLSNNSAKLGAISNAEEKEAELLKKQKELLGKLKRQYPDYVISPATQNVVPATPDTTLVSRKQGLRQQQYDELTNLVNAFSLEYEFDKNFIPASLTPEQEAVKKNAAELNAESKRALILASQAKDENEKLKLLTLAAKSGHSAVRQVTKLIPGTPPQSQAPDPVVITNPVESPVTAPETVQDPANSEEQVTDTVKPDSDRSEPGKSTPAEPVPTKTTPPSITKVTGVEIVKGNAYSNAKPIPIDAPIESGLMFRVQIGAFRTQIPDNAFKGLSPLNGETATNGYIRYTAGNFNRLENANAVKNDLRGLGYSDAFVVAYHNGKRVSLAEAMNIMKDEGITLDPNAPKTAGITANTNVPKATANTGIQEVVAVTKELDKTNGLLFTIQIGVYNRQVTKTQLRNLRPIFTEPLSNGLYRYTAGIYNNADRVIADKLKVVELGIRDAFVSAYLNGARIPFNEAREKQSNDATIRMESENPVIFAGSQNPAVSEATPSVSTQISGTVQPFTNGISAYPVATPENGIKENEDGISFKVQIGAFSKQVPEDVAAKFSAIRSWPVENKQANNLFIYNVGNFSEVRFAKELRDQIIQLGITDAFIVVYRDGRKLYGTEAESYLR